MILGMIKATRTLALVIVALMLTTACNTTSQEIDALTDFCRQTRANDAPYKCRVVEGGQTKDRRAERIHTIVDRLGDSQRTRLAIAPVDAHDYLVAFACQPNATERYIELGWDPDWAPEATNSWRDTNCPEPKSETEWPEIEAIAKDVFGNEWRNSMAIAWCESRMNISARGGDGERHVLQIMPQFETVWGWTDDPGRPLLPALGYTHADLSVDMRAGFEAGWHIYRHTIGHSKGEWWPWSTRGVLTTGVCPNQGGARPPASLLGS